MTDERHKRRADVQITKDDPEDSGADGQQPGGFARAADSVLEGRRKLTVKRSTGGAPKAPNPFAGISLSAPTTTETTAATTAATTEAGPATTTTTTTTTTAAKPSGFGALAASTGGFGGFGSLASANGGGSGFGGFGGLAFGSSAPANAPAPATAPETQKADVDAAPEPSTAAAATTTATTTTAAAPGPVSVFGAQPVAKRDQPAEAQQTGEEGEETVASFAASLFEFVDENGKKEWRTRGSGDIKLNKDKETGQKGRLIMRQRGVGRLLLNANVKNMSVSVMADGNGISFSCVNFSVDEAGATDTTSTKLSTFAVKLGKDASGQVDSLAAAIKALA